MDTVFFSKARAELAGLLDKVNDDAAPIEIVRRDKRSAVLISKDEYEGMLETLYLLSTPANAARLNQGKADVEAGRHSLRVIAGVNDE
ncbi:type II toxin-antitoxin system Phd/YefM family antitoxin [Rhizobium sp. KVB221]|uniref:Antitoxin n=1 Tax=Rhizobium setariae TaxID=2801340 RepID=A0A936YKN0_9HYPH|nr:type II toxin-antitoxin system prevent-host-death family antitoxin [Rhizobium setariae]MBL0372070.1 type II toxin-antitoxin system Phd/YefM family antitoxin [Rhizobium setariae]